MVVVLTVRSQLTTSYSYREVQKPVLTVWRICSFDYRCFDSLLPWLWYIEWIPFHSGLRFFAPL